MAAPPLAPRFTLRARALRAYAPNASIHRTNQSWEAFYLYEGGSFLVDDRKRNQTVPPTLWFIGETTDGRVLKVVFIYDQEHDTAIIKTAYEPDEEEIALYEANT
jgi:hypothetical protein